MPIGKPKVLTEMVGVPLAPATKTKLEEVAGRCGVKPAALVRRWIETHLSRVRPEQPNVKG
jgi:hypothetical protein